MIHTYRVPMTARRHIRALLAWIALLFVSPALGAGLPPIADHYFGATLFVARTGHVVAMPMAVGNLADYVAVYGRLSGPAPDHGYHAARLFFANGGRALYMMDPHGNGAQDYRRALAASAGLAVDLVALPGLASAGADAAEHAAIAVALAEHVDASANRFGLIDAPQGSDVDALVRFAKGFSSRHSATYAPWLDTDTDDASEIAMPSSAAVAGVISRIDRELGIFKNPAGSSAALDASIGVRLQQHFNSGEQDRLTLANVNTLRLIPGFDHILIWGARTTSPDPEWRYVATSRLVRLLRYSIDRSLAWIRAAPQPPAPAEVTAVIADYLFTYWQRGAFAGNATNQGYFIQCNAEPDALRCVVGVAPLRPSEFVVFELVFVFHDTIFAAGFEAG